MFIVLALFGWGSLRGRDNAPSSMPEQNNPTELKPALLFGLLYAVVLLAVAAANQHFGRQGLYVAAVISGLTDRDAITLSVSPLVYSDEIAPGTGWRLIVVAATANLAFKAGTVAVLGERRLLGRVAVGWGGRCHGGDVVVFWTGLSQQGRSRPKGTKSARDPTRAAQRLDESRAKVGRDHQPSQKRLRPTPHENHSRAARFFPREPRRNQRGDCPRPSHQGARSIAARGPTPAIVTDLAPMVGEALQFTAEVERRARQHLHRLQKRLAEPRVTVETRCQQGSPVPLILAHAKELGADYIVLGSHGHTALYDLVVGSTASGVLKRATCPVVVVPAQPKAKVRRSRRAQPKRRP